VHVASGNIYSVGNNASETSRLRGLNACVCRRIGILVLPCCFRFTSQPDSRLRLLGRRPFRLRKRRCCIISLSSTLTLWQPQNANVADILSSPPATVAPLPQALHLPPLAVLRYARHGSACGRRSLRARTRSGTRSCTCASRRNAQLAFPIVRLIHYPATAGAAPRRAAAVRRRHVCGGVEEARQRRVHSARLR
jgi:hypothetical protein